MDREGEYSGSAAVGREEVQGVLQLGGLGGRWFRECCSEGGRAGGGVTPPFANIILLWLTLLIPCSFSCEVCAS